MTTSPTPIDKDVPRDAANWAKSAEALRVQNASSGAINLNVEGRNAIGPLQGFGQMWQKIYRIRLDGTSVLATEVIQTWKENFPTFWPAGNHFYGPLTGIAPGEVALLNLSVGGMMPLSTGVLVLYADEESFTLMTPQGHMFAGWITFSAHEEDGAVIAQAQVLMRANDPMYELGLRFGGHKQEDIFWQHTLKALAEHFGGDGAVQTEVVCIDPKLQWSQARNIWHNSAIRTAMYITMAPLRWMHKRVQLERKTDR